MRMSVLGLSALVALVGVASATVAAATNVVAAADTPRSSVPAAGDIRVLDLGDGEPVEFAWWPSGQGPRTDASVRRVSPQPGLWTGGVEWRAVGQMATAAREGAWVARGALTAPQRAQMLWPGAAATTPVEVAMAWLNARVMGGGFALVPGGGDVLVRQCGEEAGWRLAALETRAVELGEGLALEMLHIPDGVSGGGFWVAGRGLSAADRQAILWPGAPGGNGMTNVLQWLNARTAGGGFAAASAEERGYVPEGTVDVITRRGGAEAGWTLAALETRAVEFGDGMSSLEMLHIPDGVSGGGFWVAGRGLSAGDRQAILWPGASSDTPELNVLHWLNARVAGGGFAAATELERAYAPAGGGTILVRRCGAEAGWRQTALDTRAVDLGEGLRLEMRGLVQGLPDGGEWVATQVLSAAQQAQILWPGAAVTTPVDVAVAWLNARVPGGGFAVAPGGTEVLMRRCGADAGWQQAALERRAVDLGNGRTYEMVRMPESLPGGGWVAHGALSAAQLARILPDGADSATASPAVVAFWLNARVEGGGFAESQEVPGVLGRRCEAAAPWTLRTLRNLTINLGGNVNLEMVMIQPGTFAMGSPPGEAGRQADETLHRVTLSKPFWMGKHEVTQAQWERVMLRDASAPGGGGGNPSHFKGSNLPMERVSWDDCQAFLAKLNALVPGGRFRLPTEAEWEYACRAGTTTPHAGDLDKMAWYQGTSEKKTHAVGTKRPNAWGLHDMQGNVWEWCRDWYGGAYPSGSVTDPTGPSSGSHHVFRGGSWYNYAADCRVALRNAGYPDISAGLGFRAGLSPDP